MTINYVENKNGKLFSFFRHDYKTDIDKEGYHVMIDGGINYTKFSGKLQEGIIKDLMPEIRKQFIWGKNYDENNNRLPKTEFIILKDLTTSHIVRILSYFTERLQPDQIINKEWISIHLIFTYELESRL